MKKTCRKQLYSVLLALLIGLFSWTAGGCSEIWNALSSAIENVQGYEDSYVDESYRYTRTKGGGQYYYDKLSAPQQKFYRKIRIDLDQFFDGKRSLKEYTMEEETFLTLGNYAFETFGLTMQQGLQAFDALYQDCPQYYAYDGSYMLYGENSLLPVIAAEYAQKSSRDAADARIAAAEREVETQLTNAGTDFEIFETIHSYVQQQVRYEYDEYGNPSLRAHAGNIVGVLDGDPSTNSVCVGYTFAITYLSTIFGVECISVGNQELNHAWNMVEVDGIWYHADATNSDGGEGEELFLSSEQTFWGFFDYTSAAYDSGEAMTVGRMEILPEVSKELSYSRFTYRNVTGGLSVNTALVNQRLLKIPESYGGKSVVALGAGFALSARKVECLILPTSVTKIEASATYGLSLQYIFYEGAKSQFDLIEAGVLNNGFNGAQVCFYREVKPAQNLENYWHYGKNGEPQVWSDAE